MTPWRWKNLGGPRAAAAVVPKTEEREVEPYEQDYDAKGHFGRHRLRHVVRVHEYDDREKGSGGAGGRLHRGVVGHGSRGAGIVRHRTRGGSSRDGGDDGGEEGQKGMKMKEKHGGLGVVDGGRGPPVETTERVINEYGLHGVGREGYSRNMDAGDYITTYWAVRRLNASNKIQTGSRSKYRASSVGPSWRGQCPNALLLVSRVFSSMPMYFRVISGIRQALHESEEGTAEGMQRAYKPGPQFQWKERNRTEMDVR
ncbi:hypothetical protein B0H17DRAFT_1102969 [Mycena rosella]|uniref:Uncharacterized protein n=1 Tax=Mycena rosella TaxID=1033263 RepID=A0AAD7CH80_MYCRO|nr:hypothetical protein B0H17DRAFT_1102969 [Mycena rosella]